MVQFQAVQYNVFCRPTILFKDGQDERAAEIPRALHEVSPDIDVICFCEAFDGDAKRTLVHEAARHGFNYYTETVGDCEDELAMCCSYKRLILTNGGVFAMSKHRILDSDCRMFDSSEIRGSDALAAKGTVYLKIAKEGVIFHVFATHLCAWESNQDIREKEVDDIREFILSKEIPQDEALVLLGDFNIDQLNNPEEVCEFVNDLNVYIPQASPRSLKTTCASYNTLAGRDGAKKPYKSQWLDYALVSTEHLQPTECSTTVVRLTPTVPITLYSGSCLPRLRCSRKNRVIADLSDHFPLIFTGEWDENMVKHKED
jgi:endonuclease/exonuclease/phosphatase family metal-dependent hydrolase